jgi:hypothetical protein
MFLDPVKPRLPSRSFSEGWWSGRKLAALWLVALKLVSEHFGKDSVNFHTRPVRTSSFSKTISQHGKDTYSQILSFPEP